MVKRTFLAKQSLLFCLCFALGCRLSAQTNAAPQYLFILDASGSMWQKLDNQFKITIAKSVMKNLVQKLPPEARAGLVVYGHNRKNDCEDIETLVGLAPLNATDFVSKLDALQPKGMTPIAKSIQHALGLLQKENALVTVILVSDGLETCDGDACELVRKARAQGVKIAVHVVGFGISEKDISALECIAQAGGGQYLPAENAGELAQALDKTVAPPVLDGGYLSVKVTLEGKPVDAVVKVFKKGETKETALGRTYTGASTNPRVLLLPAGEYRAEVTAITLDGKPVQVLASLSIGRGDTLHQMVDFAKGNFEILVTRNGVLSDAVVRLYQSGTRTVATQTRSYTKAGSNPVKFSVLPDVYDVEISSVEIAGRPVVRIEKQSLNGGAVVSLSHHFKSGELKVGARQGTALVDATIGIYPKKGGASVAAGRTYQTAASNPHAFTLEPGEYEVRLDAVKPAGLGKKKYNVTVVEKGTAEVTGEW